MTPSHDGADEPDTPDPWSAARARSRADVRAAFAPRTATCPECGASVEADGRRCPACGASLVATRAKWRPTPRGLAIGGGVSALVAVALVLFIGALRDDADRERAATAQRRAALIRGEKARLTQDGLPRTATGPAPGAAVSRAAEAAEPTAADVAAVLRHRRRLVAAGEAAITLDARRRAPDDPPKGTTCEPSPAGPTRDSQERDPAVQRNRYECIAFERRFPLSELEGKARTGIFGTPYWLVADYGTGELTYCKMTPRGGEAATTLAHVPVDPACRDPFKRQPR